MLLNITFKTLYYYYTIESFKCYKNKYVFKQGEAKVKNKKLIEVGKIYTYTEFCKLIGESSKIGNPKKAQLKEWKRHFDFTLEGRNIVINEIYKKLKPKEDKRVEGNHTTYGFVKDLAIINYLASEVVQEGENELVISKGLLTYRTGGISKNYFDNINFKNLTKDINEKLGSSFKEEVIERMFDNTSKNLLKTTEDSLKRLSERYAISYEKVIMLRRQEVEVVIEDGMVNDSKTKKIFKNFEATALQSEKIRNEKYKLLKEFGCKNESQIIAKGLGNEYYNKVDEYCKKYFNVIGTFNAFRINYNSEIIKDVKEVLETEIEKYIYYLQQMLQKKNDTELKRELKKCEGLEIQDNNIIINKSYFIIMCEVLSNLLVPSKEDVNYRLLKTYEISKKEIEEKKTFEEWEEEITREAEKLDIDLMEYLNKYY